MIGATIILVTIFIVAMLFLATSVYELTRLFIDKGLDKVDIAFISVFVILLIGTILTALGI